MMNPRRSDFTPIQLVLMVLAVGDYNHQLEILRQRSFVYEICVLFRMAVQPIDLSVEDCMDALGLFFAFVLCCA